MSDSKDKIFNKSNKLNKNNFVLSKRELSRMIAVIVVYMVKYQNQTKTQALYEVLAKELWKEELDSMFKYPEADEIFIIQLVDTTIDNQENINDILESNIKNKTISIQHMDKLMLSIIEVACGEILTKEIDNKIIFNQYLFLSSCFFNGNEIAIINALLDSFAKAVEFS